METEAATEAGLQWALILQLAIQFYPNPESLAISSAEPSSSQSSKGEWQVIPTQQTSNLWRP